MEEKLINSLEATKILPFWAENTIKCYASRGKLPCVRIGKRIFFDRDELKKFSKGLIKKQEGNYGNQRVKK